MSNSDEEHDTKRRNEKNQRNVRESSCENSQIPSCHRQSKRRRINQDAQRYLSLSANRIGFPDSYNAPPMMHLKYFPITREDFISDNRALAKHNEHKWQFQRIQLKNFFAAHKDEEWFKNKYHPDDSIKEKEKLIIILKKRLEVFKEFLANGKIDSVSVDAENPGPLVRLLDSVIIKLEGGTDFDLTVLNPTEESKIQQKSKHEKKETNKNTNTGENSDAVLDSDKKIGEETNIEEKYVVNKNNDADVDIQEQVSFNTTNNNDQNASLDGNKLDVNDIKKDPKHCILPVNGITNHFQVARNDIKLCASIINHLDNRSGLWQSIDGEQPAMETNYGVISRNPVLHNIIEFVIDEASAEEEELLGESVPFEPEVNTEKHVQLLKALDRMILYLRIVHSVDFYNTKEYKNEDCMPSKCHIMHARCASTPYLPTKREIADYCHYFRLNADSLIVSTNDVSERELVQLGSKDEEEEVKRFINSNTEKISKDKWLCHLSGKKFKSPEFVRQHIIRKYTDHLNDVKKEVKYFNNYLRDPNRPQLFP